MSLPRVSLPLALCVRVRIISPLSHPLPTLMDSPQPRCTCVLKAPYWVSTDTGDLSKVYWHVDYWGAAAATNARWNAESTVFPVSETSVTTTTEFYYFFTSIWSCTPKLFFHYQFFFFFLSRTCLILILVGFSLKRCTLNSRQGKHNISELSIYLTGTSQEMFTWLNLYLYISKHYQRHG